MPNTPILGPGRVPITLRVNGQTYSLTVSPPQSLAEILRGELGLTGTKVVCAMGDCGACTVWLDDGLHRNGEESNGSEQREVKTVVGTPVYSCLQLAIDSQGREITTIEGLSRDGKLHPVQEAFIADDAFQCGYCTAGQVMALAALLEKNPKADADAIKRAVSGNLCRCGAYPKIVKAGLRAAEKVLANRK